VREPLAVTDECQIRLLEEADAEELYRLIEANRAYLASWMPWAAAQTRETTVEFIQATRRQMAADDGFQAALVCGGSIIGIVGFHSVNWQHGSATIGYWLDERHQGRGLMTRAVRALVDVAFGEWNLHRVEIRAAIDNSRSRAIPERLGFREEGVQREAERIGERYNDLAVYGLLAAEWVQHPA
jgi:ribosomal-protein-serine acetyltransferase